MPAGTGAPSCGAAARAASAVSLLCSSATCPSPEALAHSPSLTLKRNWWAPVGGLHGPPAGPDLDMCWVGGRRSPPLTAGAKRLDRSPAAAGQYPVQRFAIGGTNYQPLRGDGAQQVMKLSLYRCQIGENIGMIVFKIVQYDRTRTIVDELGALIEESRIVFVGFDHEQRPLRIVARRNL